MGDMVYRTLAGSTQRRRGRREWLRLVSISTFGNSFRLSLRPSPDFDERVLSLKRDLL